jgi:hypothetical protein
MERAESRHQELERQSIAAWTRLTEQVSNLSDAVRDLANVTRDMRRGDRNG